MKKIRKITAAITAVAVLASMTIPAYAAAPASVKPVTLPATIDQLPTPLVPQNVTAEALDFDNMGYQDATSGILIKFDTVAGAKSYNVYVLTPGAKSYVPVEKYDNYYGKGVQWSGLVDIRAYTDPTKSKFVFLPETTYKFKIAAVDAKGVVGKTSAAASVTTPAFASPRVSNEGNFATRKVITAPTAAVINFWDTAWASSYELAVQVADGKDYRDVTPSDGIKTNFTKDNGVTAILTGLKPNASYNVKIRAVGNIGGKTVKSAYSEEFTVETPDLTSKTADALAGNYIGSDSGNFVTLNKNGTATVDFGGQTDLKDKNFSWTAYVAENGITIANLISSEAAFEIYKPKGDKLHLSQFGIMGDEELSKTTASSAKTPVSGTFASVDYNMSAPTLTFNKDGTGVAAPSGAVTGEKSAHFTYERKGSTLTMKFSTTPGASLHGLKKGTVTAKIYSGVTVEKVSDNNMFTLNDKTETIVANVGTGAGGHDITSTTPADYITIDAGFDKNGYSSDYIYTNGPRG